MMQSYEDALRYMYSLQKLGVKFGLRNTVLLLKKLDNPQKTFPSFIVSGTNGKGATAVFLESMLQAHGLKTGLFTSPHLVRFTERIKFNGSEIAGNDVIQYTEVVRNAIDEINSTRPKRNAINVTFFEFVTALATKYFADAKADICVFEVGMGGRLDATNAIGSEIAVILTVSLDHTDYLGDTIEKIAHEKGGIIKPNGKLVLGPLEDKAKAVITKTAKRLKAETYEYGCDFVIERKNKGTYIGKKHQIKIKELGLAGEHQWINAACAICALELSEEKGWLKIDHEAISKGLANARLDGRFQFVEGNPPFLLDGAHNPQAMNTLISNIKSSNLNKPITAVFGIGKDKNIQEVISQLSQLEPAHLIITKAKTPLAADPFLVAEHAHGKFLNVCMTEAVPEAIELAKRLSANNELILVTGSFYVVGEALKVIFPSITSDQEIPWGRG